MSEVFQVIKLQLRKSFMASGRNVREKTQTECGMKREESEHRTQDSE
jgi:hypothetical protein